MPRRSIASAFAAYAVDRVAVAGFSAAPLATGSPRIFVSHGMKDGVLPIDRCSRRIVPRLEREGYDVRYLEFDGPHAVPADVARAGVSLFLERPSARRAS